MRKNQEIVLSIKDLSSKGFGVGRAENGQAVFVAGAFAGDLVKVRLLKLKKSYAYAKIVQLIEPSADRLSANDKKICPISVDCGGCQFQELEYSAQLKYKENLLKNAFSKIGNIENAPIFPIIAMQTPYDYRSKATFPIGMVKGKPAVGMYAYNSHRVVPVSHCNIQKPVCRSLIKAVSGLFSEIPVSVYDETTHKGLLRHLVVRTGAEDVAVIFVINGTKLPDADKWISVLKNVLGENFSLIINANTSKTNVIFTDKFTILHGSGYIYETVGHIKYRISHKSFFQVNPAQAHRLFDIAASHLDKDDRVLDAYSGIGAIALYIAAKVREVVCIELIESAVEDGIFNANLNGISNVSFELGAAEEIIPDILDRGFDAIILDPPRKGCDSKILSSIIKQRIPKIIYVSCDPATFARDIANLCEGGYSLEQVTPVDMFPMTRHVESVGVLRLWR